MPPLQRVAVIYEKPSTEGEKHFREELLTDLDAAAKRLSVRTARFEVTSEKSIDRAFTDMKRSFQAVIVLASPVLTTHRPRIVDLAARHRLPAIYEYRIWVDSGGLVSYGVKISDHYRRAAQFVERILKGAKPADIPVEQPAVFELVINMKTAKGSVSRSRSQCWAGRTRSSSSSCSINAADSYEQRSASPGALCRRTTVPSGHSAPGSTPGPASATSPWACTVRASIFS